MGIEMATATKSGTDYQGNPEYVVTDAAGARLGVIVKVLPENIRFDGTASISRPWVRTIPYRGYRIAYTTLKAATRSFTY